jgi:predicted phage-related endonuclease
MDRKEEAVEKKISLLEAENKELDQELTKEQKKAAIAEAKKLYGRDWKKILFGAVKSLKVDRETLQSLHSMGVNTTLRDYNDPRKWRE